MMAKKPKNKKPGEGASTRSPTKDAPFDVDVNDDGDIATPKREVSEEELKEQEDRLP
jgi:biopolymer transport protein ExbD